MPDSGSVWFPEFLTEQFDARIILQRAGTESLMKVVGVELRDGRQLILLERSYREGLHYLPNPTAEEMEIAASGDPWSLWNSRRSRFLGGLP